MTASSMGRLGWTGNVTSGGNAGPIDRRGRESSGSEVYRQVEAMSRETRIHGPGAPLRIATWVAAHVCVTSGGDIPAREATVLRGHAVRAPYLVRGAIDVAVEPGDDELLRAVAGQLGRTSTRRVYLTGGMGSRYADEAFGDDFVLRAGRAYSETCAAVAAIMLAWRLMLPTGEDRDGDVIERIRYNVIATAIGDDNRTFFYANTLHQRALTHPLPDDEEQLGSGGGNRRGLGVFQYADTRLDTHLAGGRRWALRVATASTVGGTLFVATLGGYAFGRFQFPGRDVRFLLTLAILTLAILVVPYAMILITRYVLPGWLGLLDTLIGLSLVLIMFQLPVSIFMMRNSSGTVPRELDEPVQADGCPQPATLVRIMLPALPPGLLTVGLSALLTSWGESFAPLIPLNSTDKFTTMLAVVDLRTADPGPTDHAAPESGVVSMAAPYLALFAFMLRSYVRGSTSAAIRG